MRMTLPRLVGEPRHAYGLNTRFRNLEEITQKIVVPQPDYYEGEFPGDGNRTLRDRLNTAIVPSTRRERPFLPNFFVEAKGPDGSLTVAARQACYDGAVGTRAMHSLRSLGRTEAYDGDAYAASATLHGRGNLELFTHHMRQPGGPRTQPETHMRRVFANNLTNSPRDFREGRTAFRNLADKSNELRVRFIDDANRRNRIVTPPRIVSRSNLKPLSCQALVVEYSDSDLGSSSQSEDSDDDNYCPRVKLLRPKRLARRIPSPGLMNRRRKATVFSDADTSSSSEEEFLKAPKRRQLRKPKIVTFAPKSATRREASLRRLGLRRIR